MLSPNGSLDMYCFFFFFQAEDGIRDKLVTGVQTCALPIYGEAVALGIVAEARLALRLGVASPQTVLRQERLLAALGLPVRAPAIDADRVLAAMTRDKKARDGRVPFVLAPRIGAFQLQYDVPWDLVRAVLGELGP